MTAEIPQEAPAAEAASRLNAEHSSRRTRLNKESLASASTINPKQFLLNLWADLAYQCKFWPWEIITSPSDEFGRGGPLCPHALMFLPVNNVVRKPCIRLARWKMLEWIMLCVILANCVTLCMDSNAPGFQETVLYARLSGLNYFFIAAFSIEMTIKIIALGFVLGQHTYLRNGWNVLDFTVVCFGWLELVPGFGNYTIIRVARILRPLRLVTKIEALKILVSCIIRSLPMLGDVAVLSLFFYAISGIASVEILKGKMLYRCASPDNTTFTLTDSDGVYQNVAYIVPQSDYTQNTWPCVGPMADRVTWRNISGVPTPSLSSPGGPSSPSTVGRYCDSSQGSGNVFGQTYTYGLFCVPYQNPTPYGSYRHYDNILTAWLATFQHMAPQDWSFIMYDEWDGLIWWTWPYDILMVIIGAFLIQNLALAILFLNFTKNYAEQSRKAREIAESIRILSRRGSVASQTSSYHSSDYDYDPSSDRGHVQQHRSPYLSMIAEVWSRLMRAISALFSPLSEPWESFRDLCYELQDTKGFHIAATAMIILNAIVLAFVWYPNYPNSVNVAVINLNYAFTMFFLFEMVVKILGLGTQRYCSDNYNLFDAAVTILGVIEMSLALSGAQGSGLSALRALRLLRLFRLAKSWKSLNRMIKVMLTSIKSVAWLTVLLILFIFMAGLLGMILFGYNLDQCPIPGSSQLCPPGLTWRDCPAHFDCYVPCNASQVYQWFAVPNSPYGGQAYCEVFPRRDPSSISPPPPSPPPLGNNTSDSPPPLPPPSPPSPPFAVTDYTYNLEQAILNTSSQYWAQVGKPNTPLFSQTPSYDYFYQAFLSVFVLLTQDNWAENCHQMMQLTRPWAALYCVIILVLGTIMLLNLFLAVIIANLDDSSGITSGGSVFDPAEVVPISSAKHGESRALPAISSTNYGEDVDYNSQSASTPEKNPQLPVSYLSLWVPESLHNKTGLAISHLHSTYASNTHQTSGALLDDSQSDIASSVGRGSLIKTSHMPAASQTGSNRSANRSARAPSPNQAMADAEVTSFGNKIVPLPPALMVSLDPLGDDQGMAAINEGGSFRGARSGSKLHLLGSQLSSDQHQSSSATLGLPKSMFYPLPTIEESSGNFLAANKRIMSGSAMATGSGHLGKRRSSTLEAQRPSRSLADSLRYFWNRDASLLVFTRTHPVRLLFNRMIHHERFEYLMLVIIVISCLELCFDDAMVIPGSKMEQAIFVMDIIFASVFCIEAIIKIIALGLFWCGPESYLRSGWNWLDLMIALVSVIIVILTATNSSNVVWLRSMRSLRALRPIRLARKIEGINVVVIAIGKALPAVGEITLIGSLFYYIFAVLAVNLMAGNFDYCADPANPSIPGLDPAYLVAESNFDRSWCEANGGVQNITTSNYHNSIGVPVPAWNQSTTWGANGNLVRFDNVIMALWVLFQIGSLENWNNIMYFAMWTPVTGDWQNVYGQNPYIAIFFLFFIVFGVWLILNMVIGVSINTFNRMKDQNGRMAFLTAAQQDWLMLQKIMIVTQPKKKYVRPKDQLRGLCFDFCMNEPFDYFMITVILTNVFFMFLIHQGMSDDLARTCSIANVVFTAIFFAEMLLKWMSMGLRSYFKDAWCRFDFFVVVVSILGVILDYATTSNVTILTLLRVLRVVRIIKLVPKLRGLKMMLITIYWSLPALGNVASVLFVVLFIYSIIGMNIFGHVMLQQYLDEHANFQTFPRAILMLLRFATGENWNSVMYNCMIEEQCILVTQTLLPNATTRNTTILQGTYLDSVVDADILPQISTTSLQNQCTPNAAVTAIFFCTYMMLVIFLLLQLVIGILIENIDNLAKMEEMQVSQKHIQSFIDVWEELDKLGTGFIDASDMTSLLMRVEWPMGVQGIKNPHLKISDIVQRLSIPLRNQKIHFLETMHAMAGRVAGAEVPESEEFELHGQMITRLPKDEDRPKYTLADYYAAVYVRTSIRGFLTRAQLKVLFDELEKEMEEEELLAELEEAPRLDLGPGPIPTIMEESSRLSGVSSLQPEASAVRSPLQANPSRSRLQVQSAQAGAEGEKPLDYPSSSALNEEPSLPRRVINERLTQSRRDLFRQVTNARSTGAIVDVESLIKKHQDARFPARASLTSTSTPHSGLEPSPVSSDIPRNPHRALSPEDSESEQPARQSLRSYDESEDHPSSHVTLDGLHSSPTRAAPLLPSLHEEEDEVEGKEGEEALQPQSQTREESQVTPSGDQADANAGKPGRGLSLVLEYIESPRNE